MKKKFRKSLAGVSVVAGVICAMAVAAPAANAAAGKELVLISQAATRSAVIEESTCQDKICSGASRCVALPGHNTGAAVVAPGITVYNGDKLKVVAYNSGNCTGGSTRTVSVTVQSNNSDYWLDIR